MGEQNIDMLIGAINELAGKVGFLTFSMYIVLYIFIAEIAILKRSERQTDFQEALNFELGKARRLYE